MKVILFELKKHIILFFLYIRRYMLSQMEYRGNFFTFLILESIVLCSKLLYVLIIYKTGVVVNGLPPDAILMFTGTFFIVAAVYGSFFMLGFFGFSGLVANGNLDLYMVKPVSLQFMSTLTNVDLAVPIPNLAAGIILVARGWRRLGIPVNAGSIAGYAGFIICGVVIIYSVLLFPQLLSFWIVRTGAVNDVAAALSNFNIMPMHIYKKWMQRIGTFVIPIFLITNFPPLFILGRLNSWYIAWGIAAPVIFFILIRLFWRFSIKRYSSASC